MLIAKIVLYYFITICGATGIVYCFSKRKAFFFLSTFFVIFFAFFNYFSTGLHLFFMHLQNVLFSVYDSIFERIRMLTEGGNSTLFRRLIALLSAFIVVLIAIKSCAVISQKPIWFAQVTSEKTSTPHVRLSTSKQPLYQLFERYNC